MYLLQYSMKLTHGHASPCVRYTQYKYQRIKRLASMTFSAFDVIITILTKIFVSLLAYLNAPSKYFTGALFPYSGVVPIVF